jgi:hypothetical protein
MLRHPDECQCLTCLAEHSYLAVARPQRDPMYRRDKTPWALIVVMLLGLVLSVVVYQVTR